MAKGNMDINLDQLKSLTGGDSAFMIEILELIEKQSPHTLASMSQSFASQDYSALGAAAHKYKSSINFLGNPDLIKLMKDIEWEATENEDHVELPALLEEFETICTELTERISLELSELRKSSAEV